MVNLDDIKKEAHRILEEEKVKYVIGYSQGSNGFPAVPAFVKNPEDSDNLIWNPACIHNLTRFLRDEKKRKTREKHPDNRPVGIMVKGCDSRAINVLLQENYITREDVYILGISCENMGVVDEKKLAKQLKGKKALNFNWDGNRNLVVTTKDGKIQINADEFLADRCLECPAQSPVVYDILFGDKIQRSSESLFKSVENYLKSWINVINIILEVLA